MKEFGVVTLFPDFVDSFAKTGVLDRSRSRLWNLTIENPRKYTNDVHQSVDDRPYGGGDGMVMLAEPLKLAVEALKKNLPDARVYHLSPRGSVWNEAKAIEEARDHRPLILISSRYGGVDERLIDEVCDGEISVGDYVLSGGELACCVVIDSVVRKIEGVLGHLDSAGNDSFAENRRGLLEGAQYTRPKTWSGRNVPNILQNGHHLKITAYQSLDSLALTYDRRPELLSGRDQELIVIIQNAFAALGIEKNFRGTVQAGISRFKEIRSQL